MIEKIDEDFFLVEKLNEIIEAVNELSLRNDYSDADKQDTSKDFKTETFDFSEALKRMKDGKLFKRTRM